MNIFNRLKPAKASSLSGFISNISSSLANRYISKQKKTYGYGKRKKKNRRKGNKKRRIGKKKQIGKGFFDIARNVFQTMQNASRVAKHSNPRSPFRMAVQTKYGLPSSIRRQMYKYK